MVSWAIPEPVRDAEDASTEREKRRLAVETEAFRELKLCRAPLQIVRAPAGYGKTACLEMLADKLRQAGRKCLFSSPEECLSLAESEPGALVLVDFGDVDPEAYLHRYIEYASSSPAANLVISTRNIPDIDWVSLELSGVANIIAAEDLLLTTSQISSLLSSSGLRWGGELMAKEIYTSTGGWPFGVQLALQRALRKEGAPKDIGALLPADACRKFVENNIFLALPEKVRQLVSGIADIHPLHPDLCAHILDSDKDDLFRRLVDQYGLLVQMPDRPGFYAFLPIIRSSLGENIAGADRPAFEHRWRRAADWFCEQGYTHDAIEYYLNAGDQTRARDLLLSNGSKILHSSGDIVRMLQWIDAIASAGLELPAALRLWRTWALLHSCRLEEAEAEMKVAIACLEEQPSPSDQAYADRLKVAIAARRGDIDGVRELGSRWLEVWQDYEPQSAPGVCILLALSKGYSHDEMAQRRLLMKAREYAVRCGNHTANQWILGIEALAELNAGRSNLAREIVDRAIESCARLCGTETPIYALLNVIAARIYLEIRDTDKAADLFNAGFKATRNYSLPETNLIAQFVMANVIETRFGCDAAIASIHEHDLATGRYAEFAHILAGDIFLKHGRAGEARQRYDLLSDGMAASDEGALGIEFRIFECFLLFAEGNESEADERAISLLEHADSHGQKLRVVKLLLLRAACEWRAGQEIMAKRRFARALAIAASGQLFHTVCGVGWAIKELVAIATHEDAANKEVISLMGNLRKELGLTELEDELSSRQVSVSQLTPREKEIVQLLDSNLTMDQIADKLGFRVSTLRWHLRNVYSKLSVRNRSGAVAIARSGALG
ncbi:LuxR C-terminal-related transcriptional regulator [uncultured Hyphomonas sp.]|uniref:LuxR C-terminal-related transcriptional regulator n=1 Tax=uncultured Hyphomonas sp. TaxID=225298 RepID=UPI002AAAC0A0|nr:LuxR C-terminal-related transcriptional regulator [uncultured Hyphomonas sp.]